jgi:hypothetical protein
LVDISQNKYGMKISNFSKTKEFTMKKKNILLIGLGAALATVATLLLLKRKRGYREEKPPRKAPQLPLQNPGEQSEFTTSASESDIG